MMLFKFALEEVLLQLLLMQHQLFLVFHLFIYALSFTSIVLVLQILQLKRYQLYQLVLDLELHLQQCLLNQVEVFIQRLLTLVLILLEKQKLVYQKMTLEILPLQQIQQETMQEIVQVNVLIYLSQYLLKFYRQ